VVPPSVCARVIREANDYVSNLNAGVWGSVRQSSVKTTDVAIEDIPVLRGWLRDLCERKLWGIVEDRYPRLRDGMVVRGEDGGSRMRLHDAFIVRYDENDGR